MPWCPNCREEYIEGLTDCSECGAELVDELPELKPEAIPNEDNYNYEFDTDYKEKLLFTAEREFVYVLITEALEKENILFRSQVESESYTEYISLYANQPYVGHEVFVREEDYEKAKEILDYFNSIKEEIPAEDNDDEA